MVFRLYGVLWMGTSQRSKGSYHERWWCEWFKGKGVEAKRQPLSGALGGEWASDIAIDTRHGRLVAESKYQATGRGFSFLTTTHKKQPADFYLLKQKHGPAFICIEINNPVVEKILKWLGK